MKVCIVCEKEITDNGSVPVKEDRIIRSLRRIKQTARIAKMNDLYVCMEDLKKHEGRRKSFEKGILFASIGAGIVIVIIVARAILTASLELWSILSGLILAGFILLLPLFKYTPAVESKNAPLQEVAPAAKEEKKKQVKKGK